MDDRIKQIADKFGINNQLEQAEEECAELILAIQKFKRYKGGFVETYYENVREEAADVYIMMCQLMYLMGYDSIMEIVDKKLDRQIKRMEKEGCYGETE